MSAEHSDKCLTMEAPLSCQLLSRSSIAEQGTAVFLGTMLVMLGREHVHVHVRLSPVLAQSGQPVLGAGTLCVLIRLAAR
jgi:hypothetical protein